MPETVDPPLRVVLYNVHRGLGRRWWSRPDAEGIDGNLRRIAGTIARAHPGGPDVVGLNEVDFASRRTGFVDQARVIARALEAHTGAAYNVLRGPSWIDASEGHEVRYGNALLIRHPVSFSRSCGFDDLRPCESADPSAPRRAAAAPELPAPGFGWSWLSSEPRGVTVADAVVRGRPLRVVLTHLDPFTSSLREAQAARILHHLTGGPDPVLLLGDLNAVPTALTHRRWWFGSDRTHDVITSGRLIDARLREAQVPTAEEWRRFATYPAHDPQWPLDTVLASPELTAASMRIIDAGVSDHLGLAAELAWWKDPTGVAHQERMARAWRHSRIRDILACDRSGGQVRAALHALGVRVSESATVGAAPGSRL